MMSLYSLNLFRIVSGIIISLSSGAAAPAAAFDSLLVIFKNYPLLQGLTFLLSRLRFVQLCYHRLNRSRFHISVVFAMLFSLY
jgi:hypothetical protein